MFRHRYRRWRHLTRVLAWPGPCRALVLIVSFLEKQDSRWCLPLVRKAPGRDVSFLVPHGVSNPQVSVGNEMVCCMTAMLGYARVSTLGQGLTPR